MCKAMCGVAAGACGGSINLHWSKGSDISDINAKFGAQHTVTGSLGLLFAALFAKSISSTAPSIIWTLYTLLTCLHIFANAQCMRLIAFDYLNTVRANIVIDHFLHGKSRDALTPHDVARLEPLLFFFRTRRRKNAVSKFPIRMGVSFDKLYQYSVNDSALLTGRVQLSGKPYTISLVNTSSSPVIFVSLFTQATSRDILEAYFHATLFGGCLNRLGVPKAIGHSMVTSDIRARVASAIQNAKLEMEQLWPSFISHTERQGWVLDKTDIYTEGYTIEVS